jgi:GH24 family phage-related lysozyme (muramidase)
LNCGRHQAAAEQLLRWDIAGHEENAGLKARHEAEFELWSSAKPDQKAANQLAAA